MSQPKTSRQNATARSGSSALNSKWTTRASIALLLSWGFVRSPYLLCDRSWACRPAPPRPPPDPRSDRAGDEQREPEPDRPRSDGEARASGVDGGGEHVGEHGDRRDGRGGGPSRRALGPAARARG